MCRQPFTVSCSNISAVERTRRPNQMAEAEKEFPAADAPMNLTSTTQYGVSRLVRINGSSHTLAEVSWNSEGYPKTLDALQNLSGI